MNQPANRPWWQSATSLVTLAAIVAAVAYIAVVHIDHVVKAVPLLFILACPLLHFFMHRGHGHRHDGRPHDPPTETASPSADSEKRRDPS